MVAIAFPTFCIASSAKKSQLPAPQSSHRQKQSLVPLFVHIFEPTLPPEDKNDPVLHQPHESTSFSDRRNTNASAPFCGTMADGISDQNIDAFSLPMNEAAGTFPLEKDQEDDSNSKGRENAHTIEKIVGEGVSCTPNYGSSDVSQDDMDIDVCSFNGVTSYHAVNAFTADRVLDQGCDSCNTTEPIIARQTVIAEDENVAFDMIIASGAMESTDAVEYVKRDTSLVEVIARHGDISSSMKESTKVSTWSPHNIMAPVASQTEERHKQGRGVSGSWEGLWQFKEESDAEDLDPCVPESEYTEVISMILNIARNLPKNSTLQEHLDPFSGRIDSICGNVILHRLQREHLFVSAFSFFEWMRLHTPSLVDSRSLCSIFTILGNANMVDWALVLFDNMKCRKDLFVVQVFNALLSALSKHARYEAALSIFQEMSNLQVQADSVTFCILLDLSLKSGSGVKVIWQIFSDMEEQKVFASHEVFGALMKAFCKEGFTDEALKLLSVMEGRGLVPNIVIFNTLIDAFGKAGKLEEAEGLVSEMKGKGINMSIVTYNILVDAYANTRNFAVAESILQGMLDKGPEPNVRTYTSLIAAYGRQFMSEKAASVFLRMKKNGVTPNAIAYTSLIHAYAEDGWYIKAEFAFENMIREGFSPTVETYTSLLHGFRQAGDVEKVKSIWKRMRTEKCYGTRATYNVIMDACAKQGCYADARDVIFDFNTIGCKPDRKTYNMLLNAYCRGGQHLRAPEILKEMQQSGFAPDSFTYTTLIFSCFRVRDFTQAFEYHDKMCRDNQLPDKFTYGKLRAILDAKYEVRTERNMKTVIGVQKGLYTKDFEKPSKSFRKRKKPARSTKHRGYAKGDMLSSLG